MFVLVFGSLIVLHVFLVMFFYRRGNQIAAVFNASCISLLVYVLSTRA